MESHIVLRKMVAVVANRRHLAQDAIQPRKIGVGAPLGRQPGDLNLKYAPYLVNLGIVEVRLASAQEQRHRLADGARGRDKGGRAGTGPDLRAALGEHPVY